LLLVLQETAQDGVGNLAIHLDVPFAGKGEGARRSGRAGVAEQAAKDVGEEIESRAVSLKSSERPEAMRLAQCWSLGCQSPTRSDKLNARTC